ncbi:alpha-L-fucosidase [Neobacillus mesonae]|uniref:alpha-L-fucosidase n=1 Tax=Neobacillus mesonae TaxID=1193713 RepID=UPI002E1AC3F0|nr:alpha-L-fucosidase [Neobacillus mesonae]MED4207604.1 alpha-L-fucosidase [Neobacillus mesonae]
MFIGINSRSFRKKIAGAKCTKKSSKQILIAFIVLLLVTSCFPFSPKSTAAALTSKGLLDVEFKGQFTEKDYTKAVDENVNSKLVRRSGTEQIIENQGVNLKGGTDGIDFNPEVSLGSSTVDQKVVIEAGFKPDSGQSMLNTLISIGGNIYVRYRSATELEYGFEVNNNGKWTSIKKSIPAPEAGKDHRIAVIYQPTDSGAELLVYLNDQQLPAAVSTNGKPPRANTSYAIGFGNEVHTGGLNRGFKGLLSRTVVTSFEGDFHPSILKTMVIQTEEQETISGEFLDVGFGGVFSTEKNYTNPTGEIMDGGLTRRTGNEEIDQGRLILNGGKSGIDFNPRVSFLGKNTVDQSFVVETSFRPDASPENYNTLISVGGNIYVRFTSATTLEYGFDVNNSGSWTSHKKSIAAPAVGKDHAIAIVYEPSVTGATLRLFLNGVEQPSVSSSLGKPPRAGDLKAEIGFGNEVHPGGADRGFKGSLTRVVVTAFKEDFTPTLLKTMKLSRVERSLSLFGIGSLDGTNYQPSNDENIQGKVDIYGGTITGLGRIKMAGDHSRIVYNPATSIEAGGYLAEDSITEIVANPDSIKLGGVLIDLGGAVIIRRSLKGESLDVLVNNQIVGTADVSGKLTGGFIHLSMIYRNNGDNKASVSLWWGQNQLGDTITLTELPKAAHNTIGFAGTAAETQATSLAGEVYGAAYAKVEGEFRTDSLGLLGGPCVVPTDLEPGNRIQIKPGECAAAIAAKASYVRPTPKQVAWQQYEQTAFLHYGINTYYDVEWGNFNEDPNKFQPTSLDTDQWAKTLKESGFKMAVLTVKHHDGFLLYPSRYTKFGVAGSSWRDGKGDVLGEFVQSMRKYGIKVGVYLSPADHKAYTDGIFGNGSTRKERTIPTMVEGDNRTGKSEFPSFKLSATDYGQFFLNQLYEVLTQYGEIDEVWFDGAQGHIPSSAYEKYDWDSYYKLINELQPQAVIAVTGPDVRWVGNESGWARENEWSVLAAGTDADGRQYYYPSYQSPDLGSRTALTDAAANGMKYLTWWPAEVDVSIRSGWFYHANQQPKSLAQLRNIYYQSVARNSVLLLNIPPNKEGKFAESDVARLKEWHESIKRDFAINYTKKATIKATNSAEGANPNVVKDGNYNTSWETASEQPSTITFSYEKDVTIDKVVLQEDINHGQQVESFAIDVRTETGDWKQIYTNQAIGYKRIILLSAPVSGKEFRVRILKSRGPVHMSEIGFYQTLPEGQEMVDKSELDSLIQEAQNLLVSATEGVNVGEYPKEAKDALQSSISKANDLMIDLVATREQVDVGIEALKEAFSKFKTSINVEGDKAKLTALIETAQNVYKTAVEGDKIGEYPSESMEQFSDAIEAAKKVEQVPATQKQIDDAQKGLQEAFDTFKSSINVKGEKADLTSLVEKVNEVLRRSKEGTDIGEYPKWSEKTLREAVKEARKIEKDRAATQRQVDAAVKALQEALDRFESSVNK